MLIETKRLTLRAIEPEDAEFLSALFNEPAPSSADAPIDVIYPISVEEETSWISSLPSRLDEAHMIIEKRKGRAPVGILSVDKMDWASASARLRIRLTDESWRHGYGTEAVNATVAFMFDRMNFRRIWLRVDEENARAIRCFERSGFVLEGVLREDHMRGGRWRNSLLMSMLQGDPRRGERD